MISFQSKDMGITPLSNEFIDKYMPFANFAYSLIYIYALRHFANGTASLSEGDIAETFKILESDVIKAWEYWAEKGLVKMEKTDSGLSIEFLKIPAEESTPLVSPSAVPVKNLGEKPSYSPKEIELYRSSYDEINNIVLFCEKILGKMLNANELSVLYSFYDWLRLPIELIEYLVSYCAENGHRRLSYIEAIAIDWAENGIDTIDKAKAQFELFNKDYRDILKALGLSGRNPAPKEIEFIERWLKEYNLPVPIILEACDRTVISTGKGQFKYTEKILSNWYKAGVKTIADIKKLEESHKENNKAAEKTKEGPKRVNRFANFAQREKDYDQLEKMEAELLLKGLKDTI